MHFAKQWSENNDWTHGNRLESAVFFCNSIHHVLGLHFRHGIAGLALFFKIVQIPVGVVVAIVGRPIIFCVDVAGRCRMSDRGERARVNKSFDGTRFSHGREHVGGTVDGTLVYLAWIIGSAIAHGRADMKNGTAIRKRTVVATVIEQVSRV